MKQSSPVTGSKAPLGLFGGRFDPVHRAHIHIAQAVANQLNLDEVRWIVTGRPVHKPTVASADHRIRMVELALAELGDQRMMADNREIIAAAAGGTNYSADTIASFQAEFPGRPLVWILGQDQLEQFQTWSRWAWILKNVTLAVCRRPGGVYPKSLKTFSDRVEEPAWIKLEPSNISSTEIRKSLQNNKPKPDQIQDSVFRYIQINRLYQ